MKFFFCLVYSVFISTSFAQQNELVDFLKIDATVEPNWADESIKCTVKCSFKVLKATDSVYLDAINMQIEKTALESVRVVSSEEKIWLINTFEPGKTYTAFFEYSAKPKQTLYFTGDQIWTQGQGKYTSHWLPSIDDMNDKIEFDLTIVANNAKQVIANGENVNKMIRGDKTHWKFDMKNAMSSYLVAFAIGDFERSTLRSQSGIPIELYIGNRHLDKLEPTYRHSQEIFDFLEREIGVPFPWQNYKQVPVRDFLYAGMENTTATFFSEAFVVDSIGFNDRNYVNVNAHELVHQWFGNLVTETEGTHHWLHEGFATYYALLAEKELFGEDYYYWKLLQTAEQLKTLSNEGKGEALLNAKASSLTFYEKGAWALHILSGRIGEEAFREAVKNYLNKYAFKNVTTEDFLSEVEAVTPIDINPWKQDWLLQSAFKEEQAYQSLMQSSFIQNYFKTQALGIIPFSEKKSELVNILKAAPNDYIGQEVIYQLREEPIVETMDVYVSGFESDNLYIRQAIALTMETIPVALQSQFESLLKDPSYVTQEAALFGLWRNFPEKSEQYLDQMSATVGFQDKNIRSLWLALALVTPNYRITDKEDFKRELLSYTEEQHSFEIRERAFGYVYELQLFDANSLSNLVNAAFHHSWRFRKFARELLNVVAKDSTNHAILSKNLPSYSEEQQQYLIKVLNPQ